MTPITCVTERYLTYRVTHQSTLSRRDITPFHRRRNAAWHASNQVTPPRAERRERRGGGDMSPAPADHRLPTRTIPSLAS